MPGAMVLLNSIPVLTSGLPVITSVATRMKCCLGAWYTFKNKLLFKNSNNHAVTHLFSSSPQSFQR